MLKYVLILTIIIQFSVADKHDRGLKLKKMREEQRVALVIGNNDYKTLGQLKNPVNDARAMKGVLEKRGFKVIYRENADKREMKKALRDFGHEISKGGVGLYYFAGHGVNVNGHNYLVGTDSVMTFRDEVEYETLALNLITKKMKDANNRLNVIILDACRNDPYSRGGGGGLAPISNAKGILVAYATEAGAVASDGISGKNGIYTKYLVKNMQEAGVSIEKVFKNTLSDVYDETKGAQSPVYSAQIRGEFFFTLPQDANGTINTIVSAEALALENRELTAKVPNRSKKSSTSKHRIMYSQRLTGRDYSSQVAHASVSTVDWYIGKKDSLASFDYFYRLTDLFELKAGYGRITFKDKYLLNDGVDQGVGFGSGVDFGYERSYRYNYLSLGLATTLLSIYDKHNLHLDIDYVSPLNVAGTYTTYASTSFTAYTALAETTTYYTSVDAFFKASLNYDYTMFDYLVLGLGYEYSGAAEVWDAHSLKINIGGRF